MVRELKVHRKMTIKSFSEYLSRDNDDVLRMSDHDFVEEEFSDFVLRPIGIERIEISNVVFDRCLVKSGLCVIRKGVFLRNVVMTDFSCRDGLHISAEVGLENFTISGNKCPSVIVIRRQSDGSKIDEIYSGIGTALDISDYSGEVSITGVPANIVNINPDQHVVIRAELLSSVDWKSNGFSPLSYWRLMARKVLAEKASEGIFSFPSKTANNYAQSVSELDILRKQGVVS